MAASWKGTAAPPSRYDPQLPIALMNSLGPRIQAMRQPGRRKRFVRPCRRSSGYAPRWLDARIGCLRR